MPLYEINYPPEKIFCPQRNLQGQRSGMQPLFHHRQHTFKIRPHPIHLIHKTDPGYVMPISLMPHYFGLSFYPGNRVQNHNPSIQHPETTLHFRRKIHMPRRINNIDTVIFPMASCSSGGNGNSSLSLLLHPIHHRCPLIHSPNLVCTPRMIEHPFSSGGLARINMGNNPYISNRLQRKCPRHKSALHFRLFLRLRYCDHIVYHR